MRTNQTFSQAVEALKEGLIVRRSKPSWADCFVFRQVPCEVPVGIIPKMTSLPESVKKVFMLSGKPLKYQDQLCFVDPDHTIRGWSPSPEDVMAADYIIYSFHRSATDETVGTGTPTE